MRNHRLPKKSGVSRTRPAVAKIPEREDAVNFDELPPKRCLCVEPNWISTACGHVVCFTCLGIPRPTRIIDKARRG